MHFNVSTFMVPLWYLYGTFMVPLWYLYGTFMVPYWHQFCEVVQKMGLFGAICDKIKKIAGTAPSNGAILDKKLVSNISTKE